MGRCEGPEHWRHFDVPDVIHGRVRVVQLGVHNFLTAVYEGTSSDRGERTRLYRRLYRLHYVKLRGRCIH
jgi:hypothetical protein